jgi:hypothetical protein
VTQGVHDPEATKNPFACDGPCSVQNACLGREALLKALEGCLDEGLRYFEHEARVELPSNWQPAVQYHVVKTTDGHRLQLMHNIECNPLSPLTQTTIEATDTLEALRRPNHGRPKSEPEGHRALHS